MYFQGTLAGMELLKTNLGRLRLVAFLEGISFLLLLGIAVPLKHIYGYEEATQEVGMAHGLLFILYMVFLYIARDIYKWNLKTTFWLILAAFLPFGTFVADKRVFKPLS